MTDQANAPAESEATGRAKSARLVLLGTVFLDTLGFTMLLPITPRLVEQIGNASPSVAAGSVGLLVATYSAALLLFAPAMGRLSDAVGRRPILLLTLVAAVVDYIISGLANSLLVLFFARFLAGATGGNYAVAASYLADTTPESDRGAAFAQLGASMALGLIFGPVFGGAVAELGLRAPFWAAAMLAGLNLAMGFIFLPETLKAANRRPFRATALNPFAWLAASRPPIVNWLFSGLFLVQFSRAAMQVTFALFAQLALGWGGLQTGLAITVFGFVVVGAQAFGIGFLVSRYGERAVVLGGLAGFALSFVGLAFARDAFPVYALAALFSLGSIAEAVAQGVVSRSVSADQQGEIQGALAGINGLAWIIGSVLGASLFQAFTGASARPNFPGATFLLCALAVIGAIASCWIALRRYAPTVASDVPNQTPAA